MRDLLRLDYINSLPQPFLVRFYGDKETWWPVNDLEVQTGLMRIDVCGKLEVKHFGEAAEIRDGDSVIHDPDTFYSDWEEHNLPKAANEQPEAHGSNPCVGPREGHRPATYGQLVTGGESAATNSSSGGHQASCPSLATREAEESVVSISKAETSREETPLAEAGSGAGVVSACPALIDDVGGF